MIGSDNKIDILQNQDDEDNDLDLDDYDAYLEDEKCRKPKGKKIKKFKHQDK